MNSVSEIYIGSQTTDSEEQERYGIQKGRNILGNDISMVHNYCTNWRMNSFGTETFSCNVSNNFKIKYNLH